MTKADMLARLAKDAEFGNAPFSWSHLERVFGINLYAADRLIKYGLHIGMLERIQESGIAVRFVPEKLTRLQLEIGDL